MYTHACELEKRCPACRVLYGPQGERSKEAKKRELPFSKEYVSLFYTEKEWERRKEHYSIIELSDVDEFAGYSEDINIREELIEALSKVLTKRELAVISMSFGLEGDGLTYVEIAERLGISTSRARDIVDSAIRKLRMPRGAKELRDFVE
jgi:RNA polymerase sigma factor (sigma-70 family)